MTAPASPPVLYSARPEWADVVPVPQYENTTPLAPIFYAEEYRDVTDYFRGIVKAGEKSARVLELTEHVIRLNPAHYSAWQYRYETLLELDAPLETELALMDELADKYLKTYQVWHHRRLLLGRTRGAAAELAFVARALRADEKNYHTWAHRQWVLAAFGDADPALWTTELDLVDAMMNRDVRNNSAWHHRFFVVFQSGVREGEEDRARVARRELIYVKQNISLAPNNASAWNYLRGVLEHNHLPYATVAAFVQPYTVPLPTTPTDIVDLETPPPGKGADLPCAAAVEFLADIYEEAGGESIDKAVELWKSLADEHDTIRKKYWEYRIREAMRVSV
ncbi:protein prenylyltransferase [Mycena sp. CBHHK59/15]|nr:protein prenylyltransferase [Mycena sp. CBHHK59/15]